MNLKDISHCRIFKKFEKILLCSKKNILTEVAGESGPDLAPQNFLFNLGTLWNEKICM